MNHLNAPFPYFGGKSKIASQVWLRFGDTPNYVEPFAGSLAVLLARPHKPKIETVNDVDCYLSNFWRAVQAAPDEVAEWANWPVSEADLSARHLWLVQYKPLRVQGDPDYYDAKIAGWWLWGICSWIGGGWCSGKGPWQSIEGELAKGNAGQGINRQRPHLGNAGHGINRKLPGCTRLEYIQTIVRELSDRLRDVRVCCGDWSRVLGKTPTEKLGTTGIFLDPPYTAEANRCMGVYANDSGTVGRDVFKWAIKNGDNHKLRIAVCGYDGEYQFPDSWECLAWKAVGGYGSQRQGNKNNNATRERIWFSPSCLKPSSVNSSGQLGGSNSG